MLLLPTVTISLLKHTNTETMHSIQKKVAKRKLNVAPEVTVKNKVKKVETKLKKSATKAELFQHIEGLEKKYDALEKDHAEKIDKIKTLEEDITKLERKNQAVAKETQTESGEDFKCIECNFEGVSKEELKWHMHKNHGWPDSIDVSLLSTDPRNCFQCGFEAEDMYQFDAHTWDEHDDDASNEEPGEKALNETKQNSSHPCNLCDDKFEFKSLLMEHKKKEHTESVKECWNFSSGKCGYGEVKCWFLHSNTSKSEMICNICEKHFPCQSEYLTHRKKYHKQIVPRCRNLQNGKCGYTNENCWFNHNENEENDIEIEENKQNNEVIQKIFQMMENFTREIIKLKEMNNLQ